jgi:hypothetical protein
MDFKCLVAIIEGDMEAIREEMRANQKKVEARVDSAMIAG